MKKLFETCDVIADIKRRILEWFQYFIRLDQRRVAPNILLKKVVRQNKKGKPRLRCRKDVANDLREMKLINSGKRQIAK
jgi:hypothetical protein